ncbi:MAG TPA: peptidoglycan bridge formation glycyltransferase FemA/FemB family protein [Candidatus Caenarcaniphilales bacterium]|nr:peptidoglycan bridge formation glycyltransferase FemA/FemB family protein [Candidatus Caenarcaniphilales bacterium]
MLVREESDRTSWDQHVLTLGGHPLQSSAWGDLKEHFGWSAVRLVARDGAAAAQLLIRPLAGLAVAYVPRGPVFSGQDDIDDALVRAIERHARRRRAAFVRLESGTPEGSAEATRLAAVLGQHKFRASPRTMQPRASLSVDLRRTEDELLGSFSKGHRADIRRAQREGVTVRTGTEDDAEVLHELLRATQQRKSFGIHSAAYYRCVLHCFGERARLFVAEQAGTPVAASLVLAWGQHGIYLAAGSNDQGLRHRAGHLLQWSAIRWARDRGALTYDLWGIPEARALLELDGGTDSSERERLEQMARSDPLDGVYRFKKGWGAEALRTVPAYDRVYFAPAYWLWQRRRGSSG